MRRAGAGSASLKGDMLPAAIGKANAPASKTSDSKFDSLRGKMAAYFIAPGNLGLLNELRKFVRTSHGRFVLYWERITAIDSLLSPLRGTPAAYLNAPLACFLAYVKYASTLCFACAPFLAPKSLRQIGNPWFFGTNSESVYKPLLWEVHFVLGMDNS